MPIARFQMPDGRIGRFEVPAGLTPQQAEQLISEQVYGPKEEPKSAGFSAKDLALSAGQGLAGGLQSLSDLAGAGNVVSKKLGALQQSAAEAMTPERQAEIARREELKKKAEGNTWEEIKATLGGLAEAPLQTGIQALASSAPIIAGSFLAPPAAAAATAGRVGMAAKALSAAKNPATGIGALMGLGGQKGQDYETVKQELLAKGYSEPEAERLAQRAAEYSLQNLPRQLASTAAGGLEGALGIETALGRLGKAAPTVEKAAKGMTEPTFAQALRKNVLEEALPEAVQASTGQIGTNVALNQAGLDTDLTKGVAAQAIHDLLVGGGLGAITSPAKLSSMRKEFVANEMAGKEEYAKQERDAIAAEQAKIDATKQQFGVGKQPLALPAPASTVINQEEAPVLQNPIGNLTPDELGPEVTRYVNKYRKDNALPFLQSYSVEDIKDAMTAVNPEGEKAALDSILTAKTGFSGTQAYTAENVIDAAVEKNVATETKGFNDFLARTTGVNSLDQMSQPQLYAAFKALKEMPENTTGQQTVLPEGTNASRFKQAQYDNAVKMVGMTFEERGGKPLSVDTILDEIKEATNLETDRDARAVLDTAVKNGDLTEDKQTVFRTYNPQNDQLVSTFPTREAAEAAAKKRGLNVREATLTQVAPKAAPVVPSKPRAGLPVGYDITERTFKEGEMPTGFEITPEGKGKPLTTLTNEAEVQGKIERLTGLRQQEAAKTLADVQRYEANVKKGRGQLESMEARGETGTEGYAKAQAQQARVEDILGRRIQRLYDQIEEFSAPLKAKPVGKKDVTRTGYTITKEGKETGTFPTREAAEESILADLSDDALDALVSDKKFGGLANRAAAEQNRRRSAPPTSGKKVSEVLGNIEKEKPIPETPEFKQQVEALRRMLDKFGLGDVALKIVQAIENKADGSYAAKVIQLAIDAKKPIKTLRHEALHALKELGFFTPQQWKTLEKMADNQWIDKYLKGGKATLEDGTIVSRYDAYVDVYQTQPAKWNKENPDNQRAVMSNADLKELLREEAIADAFGDFDSSKAPAGMLTALLNKMRNFFEALGNYLSNRNFQTSKDIFGQVEAGQLKASPKNVPSQENAWKASVEDVEKADKYALKNGILPYVSEGRLDLPLNTPATKFSLKTADKYGIDPVLGIPLNKDGTVTVYYHTTKDNAVKLNASKKILSEGRSRIYLTNESNGGKIVNNSGNFDQEFDGSTVLLNINPSLLQIDEEYPDGRKDFFVPIAQGEFFNRKMNLSSIQKSRKEGIVDTFSDADMAQRMGDAVAEYNDMSPADQKARLKQVRGLLKREHNIGTLLSENGKLEKTRVGDYGLTQGDKSVASMGLGLASAQQITEKLSSCPQSAICEGLCLGETSGGNFLYGGAASEDAQGISKSSFRAGPRMMQYLKTEALVVHPEEFAVLLNHEISMFEKWAAKETERKKNKESGSMETLEKEVYQPAIRLNVTSDFRPKMWLPIFEAHPDTMFYDYTKMNGDKVADNHHLTYSSTGVGQIIDGEKVSHKTNNWNSMRGRLDRGDNVAMAFSSKSALPDTVVDEETGKTYQVWDGDNYDARFLDPKPGEDGNLFKQGMIIGLRNKASTLKEKTASKETEGFFVEYDPKRDGNSVTILDQAQFGFKSSKKVIPIAKMSLRNADRYYTQDEILKMQGDAYYELSQTNKFKDAQQRIKDAQRENDQRYKSVMQEAVRLLKTNLNFKNALGELSDAQINSIAMIKYREQAEKNIPMPKISEHDALVAQNKLVEDFLKKKNIPEPSAFSNQANQDRPYYSEPRFKAWFKDSKAVNKDGKPLVAFHTTDKDFGIFNVGTKIKGTITNPNYTGKLGSWFTAPSLYAGEYEAGNAENAVSFFDGKEGDNTMLVHLSVQNPMEYEGFEDLQSDRNSYSSVEKFKQSLIDKGHDGVVVRNSMTDGNVDRDDWVAFYPTQIKSAIGNIGTFDPTNPDIRYSLREAPDTPEFKKWFSNSKIVTKPTVRIEDGKKIVEAGKPKVMYHGTARDISEFRPKQAGAIFLTDDPSFAADFSGASEEYIKKELLYTLPEDEQKRLVKEAIKLALDNQEITQIEFKRLNTSTVNEALTTAAVQDNVSAVLKDRMETGQNVMPVYVYSEKPFDYGNPDHVQQVVDELNNSRDSYGRKIGDKEQGSIQSGNWERIESRTVQKAIRKLGFDGFYVREGGIKNLAVYSPTQIKSATGNVGTFERYNPDIRYSLRDATEAFDPKAVAEDSEQKYKSREKLVSMPITDFLKLAEFGHVKSKQDDAEQRVKSGTKFTTLPYLEVYETVEDGLRVTGHEGRHRARALLAEGYETMPVILRGDIRWSEQADPDKFDYVEKWPERIYAQKGAINEYASIPMPVTREESVQDYKVKPLPTQKYSVRNIEDEVSKLPNGVALNAAIDRLATKREQKGFIERLLSVFTPDSVDTLRQQWLNRYERLSTYDKRLAEQMGGAALLADSSAESAALMSDNANAIAARACGMSGEGGIPVYKNGFTTIDASVKGPLELLKPLAATGDPRIYQTYQFWAGAKRGSRLLATGRDHTYTPAEIAYAKSLCDVDAKGNVTGKFPEFAQVQADWIKYNDGLVAYQVATGVLSPERAAEYTKYSDYIPFYRQFDGQETLGPKIFQSISGVKPPKKLMGIKEEQEAPLADFLETIVRNTQAAVQAGMKNMAAERAIGVAVKLGEASRLKEVTARPGTVTLLENGKPVSYEVADQLFIDAVKSLNLPELPFLSIFSAPANALRNLVTKDPGFMMANLMRDSLSAWVTSGQKMTPLASTISNFTKSIGGKDATFLALKNAGVIGGYEFAQDVETSGSLLGAKLRKATGTQQGLEKGLRPFNSLWEGLEKGTEASDAATRMAVYNSVMERTGNEAEAIYRAMEVMNFNRKGNLAVVRILTAAVPFLNARMQGLDVFYRAAFGKNASADAAAIQKSFFIRGSMLTALTTMYWFATHDDDEYKRQEQEVRDNNWLFPAAGIRIPTPFEVGTLFKVIPERILEYSFGTDTGKDLSESMTRALISTFAFNPIPQTVLPLVEARTNYSFYTMRPIVGQGMEGIAPEYQVGPNTTQIAQSVGKTLGVSPMKIDHIVNGYTGTMGMYLVEAIDQILSINDASPKASKRFEQMPVIKRFALDKEAKGTVTAYYDLKNSVDQVVRTMNLMERTAQGAEMGNYIKEHAMMFGMRDYVSSVEKDMKQLREATVKIRSSSMEPDAKRDALRAITEAQNQLTGHIKALKKSIDK